MSKQKNEAVKFNHRNQINRHILFNMLTRNDSYRRFTNVLAKSRKLSDRQDIYNTLTTIDWTLFASTNRHSSLPITSYDRIAWAIFLYVNCALCEHLSVDHAIRHPSHVTWIVFMFCWIFSIICEWWCKFVFMFENNVTSKKLSVMTFWGYSGMWLKTN